MRKTGFAHNPRLRPETLALVNKLPGRFPLACPYAKRFGWEWYWKHYVTAKAGVRHGGMQQLRRTAATHLAREHPESVTRFLGHRCPEMAQHYIDWSIAAPMSHLPPALPEAKPAPKTLNGNGSQKQQRTPAGQFGALHD
jgi:integrase